MAETKFYLASGVRSDGSRYLVEVKRPEHQLGDARYFPAGLTNEWQLRPMTIHDLTEGLPSPPGLWMLARRLEGLGNFYNRVALPFSLRKNTPANARAAYARLIHRRPELGRFDAEMDQLASEIAAKVSA